MQEWDCPVSTLVSPLQHLPDTERDPPTPRWRFNPLLTTHTITHALLRHPPSGFNLRSNARSVRAFFPTGWEREKNIEETNDSFYGARKLLPCRYYKVYVYIYCRKSWDLEPIFVRELQIMRARGKLCICDCFANENLSWGAVAPCANQISWHSVYSTR